MTREAFWGMSGPRCDEHLLVHRLRGADCFVPEFDVVAEFDGTVVGHVVWSRATVVYGHPDYYPRFGFRRGAEAGITAPGGATFDALMALPLVPGGLDGVRGEVHEDPVFRLESAEVEEFDATFTPKEPAARTALGEIEGRVQGAVVEALLAHGLTELEQVFRFSSAEVAAWDGVGAAGAVALRAAVRRIRTRCEPGSSRLRPPDGP